MRPAIPGICQAIQIRRLSREFHLRGLPVHGYVCWRIRVLDNAQMMFPKPQHYLSWPAGGVGCRHCADVQLRGKGAPAWVSSYRWISAFPFLGAWARVASWVRLWLLIYNLIHHVWRRGIRQASCVHPRRYYDLWGRHLMLVLGWDRQTRFRVIWFVILPFVWYCGRINWLADRR